MHWLGGKPNGFWTLDPNEQADLLALYRIEHSKKGKAERTKGGGFSDLLGAARAQGKL